MQLDMARTRNLSHNASSPSSSLGSSFDAAMSTFMGSLSTREPLRKIRSLRTVSKVFCMAGPAFHISSRNTTSAEGR